MSIHQNSGYYCEWPSNGIGIFCSDPIEEVIRHLKFIISIQKRIDLPHCRMVVFEVEGEQYTLIHWKGERLALDASAAGAAKNADSIVESADQLIGKAD